MKFSMVSRLFSMVLAQCGPRFVGALWFACTLAPLSFGADTPGNLAGAYFGTFSSGAGSFAIHVRADNTAVFLGYLPNAAAAITSPNVTVGPAGQFSFSQGVVTALIGAEGQPARVSALAPVLVSGVITAGGVVTGAVAGGVTATLTGTRANDAGATAALAGFFEAGVADGSGLALAIVGGGGQAFLLAQAGAILDGGAGTVNAAGQIVVTTGRSRIEQTIGSGGTISGTATGALSAVFAGGGEAGVARQRLVNFSTRARVAPGDGVALSGFVIGGSVSRQVLIRAVGPTLGALGVVGPLVAPRLDLYGRNALIATNTGVATSPRAAAIAAAAAQAGAFAFGAGNTDSAILATLAPGNYTAQVSGSSGASGIALVEVYDLSASVVGQKLLNLSGRAIAGAAGNDAMTSGFVIPAGPAKRVLVRGVGPGLEAFGIANALAAPTLTLRRGATVLAQNSRWAISPDAAAIAVGSAQVGAFGLAATDAAMIGTLAPDAYTVEIQGADAAPGVALVEIYELPADNSAFGDLARLASLSPLPSVRPDPTNAYADNPAAAALGQKFHFDRGYSGPLGQVGVDGGLGRLGETGKVSCNTCHTASAGFIDSRPSANPLSPGATALQARHTMTLINSAFYRWYNWTGNRDTLWLAGTAPGSSNGSLLSLAHRAYDAYRDEYNTVFAQKLPAALDINAPDAARFPRPTVNAAGTMQGNIGDATWNQMTPADQEEVLTIVANFAKATAAYYRLLVSRDAPFDRFVAGEASAISEQAKQGAALFVGKARCIACHTGPNFSDDQFHNLGELPANDSGRFGAIPGLRAGANVFNAGGRFSDDPAGGVAKVANLVQLPSQTGAIRTPSLRGVAQTAPYLRTGRLATLDQVMAFYNSGGGTSNPASKSPLIVPLGLTTDERAALVAFLQTLTGRPIPEALTRDTSVAP